MIYIVLAIFLPPLLNKKSSVWESRAITTLRAFGETQMAYQQVNLEGCYGSWEALRRTGYVRDDYTMGNSIENYSLVINIYKPIKADVWPNPAFTAIAFPLVTSPPGYLATFAIREDQTLRVYRDTTPGVNAWGEDGDFGARTWKPIR